MANGGIMRQRGTFVDLHCTAGKEIAGTISQPFQQLAQIIDIASCLQALSGDSEFGGLFTFQ
jgi:hypothetical protein